MISVTWHLQYFIWVRVNWVRHMRTSLRLITPPNTILGVLCCTKELLLSASLLSAAQTQTYATHVEGCHITSVPSCTSILCQYLTPTYSRVLRNCNWILIAFTNWNVLILLSCYRAGRFLGCRPMLFETASLFAVSMLLTYLLTPWCRVLLEKLTGLQLVKKLPAFHGTRRFITALTNVRHLSLSWASPIQSIYPHPTSFLCYYPAEIYSEDLSLSVFV